MGLFDDIAVAPKGGGLFDDIPAAKPGVVEDVAKSAGIGAVQGAMGMAGAPIEVLHQAARFGANLGNAARQKLGFAPNDPAAMAELDKPVPGSATFNQAAAEGVTGPFYKPQTVAGEYARTAGEFAPGAVVGPGGAIARAAQVAVPALVSETAGQVTRKIAPGMEPYARAGGAIVGGVGTAMTQAPRTAAAVAGRAMGGADDATITAAQGLMAQAEQQGVRLTWPEAIQQVTGGGTRLGDLQRVVENSTGGAPVMRPFMAERPAQVQQAGNAAIGGLADVPMDPFRTGPAVQRGAVREIADAQQAVNTATRPLYAAAERQSVGPQVAQGLASDPIYAATLQQVRSHPELNATIANLPDDSVAVVDLVQRQMRERAANARAPGEASLGNLAAGNIEGARTAPITAAERATGGSYGDYAQARAAQQTLRENFLEPLTEGPLGKLGATNDVMAQARALLPNQPAAGMDAAVSQTVRRIVRQNPDAAQNLVRTYAQTVFDEAIQANASGANQFGGAKFAAVIAGNPQQARNLEAAVRALPNGHVRWDGFQRFLEVAEATGQRQQTGSATAFNQTIQDELKRGGMVGEAANAIGTGGLKVPGRLRQWYEELRMGRNTEQLARIFTDPRSEPLLRELARQPAGSGRAQALALRLTYLAGTGGQTGP